MSTHGRSRLAGARALLPIPTTPSLVGAGMTVQALAFSPFTPANLVTSDGLEAVIGN